ncbi:MAG TPA: hypothetical protein VGO61_03340 [Steroidobacteraceae bacterium]|jgi:hypothetical protein|nr:hypothetical protein [Steroidobacteraceae bacterium]
MKAFRIGACALVSLALLSPAWADVRTLHLTQKLAPPANQTFTNWGQAVAIDGGAIVVVAAYEGGQAALLYQLGSNGKWNYRRVLTSVTGPLVRTSVRMKNGIAAVQFGDAISIFEFSGGDYVPGRSAAPIRHPGGLAISADSILIGGDDCDYDAVVYQKGSDGNWGITGRLDDNAGECRPQGLDVELNYDYALLRVPSTHEVQAWRRNGTALAWVRAGDLNVPPDIPTSAGPAALQKTTAVTPSSVVFRRSGATWTQQGTVMPVDYANGTSPIYDLKYRDGVLLTTEFWPNGNPAQPYAYLETSPGKFEHLAILQSEFSTVSLDISGRTVVAITQDYGGRHDVVLYVLPTQLKAPPPILNDFEDHDLSDFTFSGGQYALATRGTDDVLAQDSGTGLGVALMDGSETSDLQRVEADITPTFSATGGWVGLVARYVDADNYYFVAIRSDNTFGLYRRVNGADTLLADATSLGVRPTHVALTVDSAGVHVLVKRQDNSLNEQYVANTTDTTLRHGRAGLATFKARADFDDVRFAATEQIILMTKDYDNYGYDFGRPFTERGGDWQVQENESGDPIAVSQLDMSGYALATIGTPVENLEIITAARVESFGSSDAGAWLGLLARFVDPGNYYYVAVRNSNQIQIRKKVNGVITILASASFTAVPGQTYAFRFRVIGDMLQLFVNSALVASAHDAEIKSGQYGIGTYRAAATWSNFTVLQP